MPSVGSVIDGKYRLDRLVGSGGMGLVYAATHLRLAQSVAVKLVRMDRLDTLSATARLVREARAVALLTSEYLARVQDVGVLEDSSPYLVMELLAGQTLQARVSEGGALSVGEASEFGIQICHALGDAHSHGIVHRDVKPSNLFVTQEGSGLRRVKVIDFGISKARCAIDGATMAETRTGALLGSPPFMSPEQVHAANDVDGRSDLWSLGVVLYFLVSGRLPFDAPSLLNLMTQIAYEPPPPLTGIGAGVPQGFADVVARCLSKRPEKRYPSAAALAEALAAFAPEHARWIAGRVARPSASAASAPIAADVSHAAPESGSLTLSRGPRIDAGTVDGVASSDLPGTPPSRVRSRSIVAIALAVGATIGALAVVGISRSLRPSVPSTGATTPAVLAPPVAAVVALPEAIPDDSATAISPSRPVSVPSAAPLPTKRGKTPPATTHLRAPVQSSTPVLPNTPD